MIGLLLGSGLVVGGAVVIGTRYSRLISEVLAYAGSLLSLFLLFWILRLSVTSRQIFPRGTFTPEGWKEKFSSATPWRQERLLFSTMPESMGLEAEEFLSVLIEVEASVGKDPALSMYWNRRDQLEQALRQERQG